MTPTIAPPRVAIEPNREGSRIFRSEKLKICAVFIDIYHNR